MDGDGAEAGTAIIGSSEAAEHDVMENRTNGELFSQDVPGGVQDASSVAGQVEDENNQEHAPSTSSGICPSQVTAMVSNFSTSYNAVNISLVIPILESLYESTEEDVSACASSLLAGMMVGQVLGGALGDSFLGRLGALRLVMALQIVASIGSCLIFDDNHVFLMLAIWRFFLGIGAGGVYPLAAILSAEQEDNNNDSSPPKSPMEETHDEKLKQIRRVVLTFSMQGVGFLAVPLVTVPLLYLLGEEWLKLVWRLVLGLGALPGLVLMVLQWQLYRPKHEMEAVPLSDPHDSHHPDDTPFMQGSHDLEEHRSEHDYGPIAVTIQNQLPVADQGCCDEDRSAHDSGQIAEIIQSQPPIAHKGWWDSIRTEPNLAYKLLGTAGTWFLFDVLFYGNTLFEPLVMEAAFGGRSRKLGVDMSILKKAATDSLLVSTIALPGYAVSALVIGRRTCHVTQTPRFVQLQGFAVMALLYATIGAYWSYLEKIPWLLVLLYGLTFFFANYGPNTTTFTLPSLMYSHDCRSTLNGVSAAAGKAGALLGATLFEPAAEKLGDNHVMLICAAISVVAFALSHCCVRLPANPLPTTS